MLIEASNFNYGGCSQALTSTAWRSQSSSNMRQVDPTEGMAWIDVLSTNNSFMCLAKLPLLQNLGNIDTFY